MYNETGLCGLSFLSCVPRIATNPVQYESRPTRIHRRRRFRGTHPPRWTRVYCNRRAYTTMYMICINYRSLYLMKHDLTSHKSLTLYVFHWQNAR